MHDFGGDTGGEHWGFAGIKIDAGTDHRQVMERHGDAVKGIRNALDAGGI